MKQILIDSAHSVAKGVTGVAAVDGVNTVTGGQSVYDIALKAIILLATAAPAIKNLISGILGLFKKQQS